MRESNPEPVDTTVQADVRVFPLGTGNETLLDIDRVDTDRVRIRHEYDQVMIITSFERT